MGGVSQFINLSSMSVYGKVTGHITKETPARPKNAYGRSKAEADAQIHRMADENYKVTCLRPPIVYGKNCKGNYSKLRSIVLKSPIFPKSNSVRSMVYIGNLCEFIKECIDFEKSGLFFPQNKDYVNVGNMAELIAREHEKKIRLIGVVGILIKYLPFSFVQKAFGTLTYEKVDLVDKYKFEESIKVTEENGCS